MSHCSLLKVFVPNSLQVNHHFFFSDDCACNICDQSEPSFPWLGFSWFFSPTAHTALSLRLHVPSGSLIDLVPVDPSVSPSSRFSNCCRQNYLGRPVLPHLQLLLCVQSHFPFQRGPTPPQCPVLIFCNLLEIPITCFTIYSMTAFL